MADVASVAGRREVGRTAARAWSLASGLVLGLGVALLLQSFGLIQLTWASLGLLLVVGLAVALLNTTIALAIGRARQRRAQRRVGVQPS